jgi:putative transposase
MAVAMNATPTTLAEIVTVRSASPWPKQSGWPGRNETCSPCRISIWSSRCPSSWYQLTLQNPRVLYDILFNTAAQALMKIAADPKHLGAEIEFLFVLHTWGQNLQAHPHVHCVVPGGGIAPDGKSWVSRGEKFFLPVRVLSRLYRGLFVAALRVAYDQKELQFHGQLEDLAKPKMFNRLLKKLSKIEWVVYAKRPFGGPDRVVDYLGLYTHKVAISNHRLLKLEDGKVTFRWKDYRRSKDGAGNITSTMTLEANEFIRRFLLHVLPRGFVRIRRFGIRPTGRAPPSSLRPENSLAPTRRRLKNNSIGGRSTGS